MKMQGKSSKSIITDLLSILHAAHRPRCSALHAHGIPLRAWRSVALPRVRASLLGSRPCRRPLLLLRIGVGSSIWLPAHLPYLVHWAWRLEDTQREYFIELKQWIEGLAKVYEKGLTLEIIVCHSLMVWGLMIMVCLLPLLDCAVTHPNKL